MFCGFVVNFLGITIAILPAIDGAVRFTKAPPPILYVSGGGTAKFVWEYHVDDRDSEFFTTSPEWYYSNSTTKTRIATEAWSYVNGRMQWIWSVSPSCPARLKHRLSKKSVATLVISNVSTLDNGDYSCLLVLRGGKPSLESSVQLIATAAIHSPGPLTREVGQDVVFMFNASKVIEAFNWGIRDGNTYNLERGLINYDKIAGMKLDEKINSSSYAGRVSYVGDLSKGQAWFKITNLNINDTNQYMAKIYEQGALGYAYGSVLLTVVIPPSTTRPPQTTTLAYTHASVASRNITSSTTWKTIQSTSSSLPSTSLSENQSKPVGGSCISIIAACVTIIVILLVIVVALIIYICRGKITTEKTARKSLSSSKAEDIEAYENANQIDDALNVRVHQKARPKIVEKELYETICENREEGGNPHPGLSTLAANEMTKRDPSVRGQDPIPTLPQHYQELTNLPKGQQIPLYEPLHKRNTNHSTDAAGNPRTYAELQQNVTTGREYQSLQIVPNKEESKV